LPAPAATPLTLVTPDGASIAAFYSAPTAELKAGLLLVPMLGRTHTDYEPLLGDAAAAGYATLALDVRGQGASKAPGGKTYDTFTTEQWLAAKADIGAGVKALGDKIGDAPVIIVGASIGANLALVYAADHGDQIRALALLSPGLDYHGVTIEKAAQAIRDKPLFVAWSDDDSPSQIAGRKLQVWRAAKGMTFFQYPGKAHGTALFEARPELRGNLLTWLGKAIG
jgi:alpha-beta hydrolase superfamily lysophospholipase